MCGSSRGCSSIRSFDADCASPKGRYEARDTTLVSSLSGLNGSWSVHTDWFIGSQHAGLPIRLETVLWHPALTLASARRQEALLAPLGRPATHYMPRWWARTPLGTTRTLEQAARLAQARARRSPAAALQAPATGSTMAAPRVLFGCLDFIRARARRQHALRLQVARASTTFYAPLVI